MDELTAANAMAQATGFGRVGTVVRPFTSQVLSEIRRQFLVDAASHKRADDALSSATVLYDGLRMATFFLTFVPFLFVVVRLSTLVLGAKSDWLSGIDAAWDWLPRLYGDTEAPNVWTASLVIAAAGGVLFLVRLGIRWIFFDRLQRVAESFSNALARQYDEILSEVTKRATEIRNRGGATPWPARARDATKISIWQGKRAEYLDRYMTTVLWKVQNAIETTEWVAWVAKFALGLLVLATIWGNGDPCGIANMSMVATHFFDKAVLTIVAVPIGVYVWGFSGRRGNSFWTENVTDEAKFETKRTHYVNAVAAQVENLVIEVMSQQRGRPNSDPAD